MGGFTKAVRRKAKLRAALIGPAGSGKTFTALKLASYLAPGKVALIDTEHGSASKYAPQEGQDADPERGTFAFDTLDLTDFDPRKYVAALGEAEKAGYEAVVVDSLSHAWVGKGGALDLHDKAVARQSVKNSFAAWADVTPIQRDLVEAMLACKAHLLVTMRAEMDYVQEKDERTGKLAVRKVGLAPVQRKGMEYEFDLVGDLDQDNTFSVTKSRCPALSGQVFKKPGRELASALADWLGQGGEVLAEAPAPSPPQAAPALAPAPLPPGYDPHRDPAEVIGAEQAADLEALLKAKEKRWDDARKWLRDQWPADVDPQAQTADLSWLQYMALRDVLLAPPRKKKVG